MSSAITRERLVDAGERLFAERGIDAVSVADITRAAGQRNGAAIHYHFGGRDGLLDAILARHHERLDAVRFARLDAVGAAGSPSVRDLVAIVVEPMVDLLATDSGRAFLTLQARRAGVADGSEQPSASMVALRRALERVLPDADPDWRRERGRLAALLVIQRLGARAVEEDRGRPRPSRRALAASLIAAATAVLGTVPDPGSSP